MIVLKSRSFARRVIYAPVLALALYSNLRRVVSPLTAGLYVARAVSWFVVCGGR